MHGCILKVTRGKKNECWCNPKVIILREEVTSTRTEESKWKWQCSQNLGVQKRDDHISDAQVFERSCQTAATWSPPAEVTPTFIPGRSESSIILPFLGCSFYSISIHGNTNTSQTRPNAWSSWHPIMQYQKMSFSLGSITSGSGEILYCVEGPQSIATIWLTFP